MKILRCSESEFRYAFEAIHTVKFETDNIQLQLATEEALLKFLENPENYLIVAIINERVVGYRLMVDFLLFVSNQLRRFLRVLLHEPVGFLQFQFSTYAPLLLS